MVYSILMSVYYKESKENLFNCFSSIYLQSLPPKEVILVLDGKLTEGLYSTIDYWKVKLPIITVALESNVGLGAALNIGLEKCSCELVARMDTDDLCMPFRFEKQVSKFREDPNLDVCGSCIIEFDKNPNKVLSKRKIPLTDTEIRKNCILMNPFNHVTVMFRKTAVIKAGGYKHMPWMEDWYLWLRMISNGCKCLNLPDYLVKVRTGSEMIDRRVGVNYVKSEWSLTKIKVSLGLASWTKSLFVFLVRALPRFFPKMFLSFLYKMSRKFL